MKRILGVVLIIIGIGIISSALYMRYTADEKQKKMIDEFNKTVSGLQNENQGGSTPDINTNGTKTPKGAIGVLKIPKIDLQVAVVEGVTLQDIKYAVGHFPGTAGIGEVGNCAIAGHRSFTYNQFFNRLDEVQVGDEIIIKDIKGQEFKYRVYEKKIVDPTDISVLNSSKDAILTLVTCHPARSSAHRLIVIGKLENI